MPQFLYFLKKVSIEILEKLFEKKFEKRFRKNPKNFSCWGFYFLFGSNNMTPPDLSVCREETNLNIKKEVLPILTDRT